MATNAAEQTSFTRLCLHLSAGWTTLLCLLAGTICIFLRLHRTPCSKPAVSTADDGPNPSPPTHKGVRLVEVTRDRNEASTDIDIIAIHGLDTTSRDTWTWKDPRDPKNKRTWVNWLRPGMLPESVDRVRIFTCDWPAELLVPSDLIQKTIEEYALLLLEGIENALFVGSLRQQDRSIVFIASCLGGLILTRALVRADDKRNRHYRIRVATRGIVFLATPFRGTSFQDVAAWAEIGLRAKSSLQDREVSRLLDSVKGSTFELEESIGKLTQLCQHKDNPCEVSAFYELGTTSLPHKAFPWLPDWFHQRKQLVDRSSATLDIIRDPVPLDRPHSLMNKFRDAQCPDYKKVAGQIRGMVVKIRAGTPLEQADTWIREKHYTEDRLKIIRLSRERLPMDQCYINLAIVEQHGQDASDSKRKGDTVPSPFSIIARQKVEAPDQTMQVELATIFNERKGSDGHPMHPRRILIRGRAGVGKTTLCKKIVYEFTKGTWDKWNELFDRVLWVPLRNLKLPERRSMARYTFEDLFSHEFLLPIDGQNLAGALSCVLAANRNKTLFLLDGLDEVSQDLTGDSGMARFLDQLLNQPNVIITSRPSAKAPLKPDLELETIGFGPNQVNEYIEQSFTDPKTAKTDQTKVNKVHSFLQERWLIQGLVRIPIQLDALCYTWDDLKPDAILNTMTGMYKEIELRLWKKDTLRLGKKHEDKDLTEEYLERAGRRKIEGFVKDELAFIESLAFTGLRNDVIDFTSEHLDSISDHFTPSLLPDKTLPSLSFLRTSDPSSEYHNRNYHFIHLTFQEYFAARYFVRQWNDRDGQLLFLAFDSKDKQTKVRPPAEFLRKHKYTVRYDIFWRFVAGLLDEIGQAAGFIHTIEQEPLDLLGPTHQRLVMHCFSEISSDLPTREALEERLARWLLFECTFHKSARLASEVEFPEMALTTALLDDSSAIQTKILQSLASRASISQSIAETVAARLDDEDSDVRQAAVEALGKREVLPDAVLTAVVARLDDEDWDVRQAAVGALGEHKALPDAVLIVVAARLDHKDSNVRQAVVEALGKRETLPDAVLTAVAAWLDHKDWDVRQAAVKALGERETLPDAVLTAVAARLDDKDSDVRQAAVEALGKREVLPDAVLTAVVARLDDEDWDMRQAAVGALGEHKALPDAVLIVVAARLDHKDSHMRQATVRALGKREALPDAVLTAMAARLDDEYSNVRQAVVKALGKHEALPDAVLTAVAARLNDENWDVRQAAIKALGKRETLPDTVLTAVAARLDDKDSDVRQAAIKALGKRETLPDAVLTAVAAQLDHKDWDVRQAAVKALGERETLLDIVLTAVAARLDDEYSGVRQATVEALCMREVLLDIVLTAAVARLDDEEWYVRWAAVRALGKRQALPDAVLTAVAVRLNDEHSDVRTAAVKALGERETLPDVVLTAVAARLDDENWYVRQAAVRALGKREALPDAVLTAMAARLNDEYSNVRQAVVKALGKHEALPDAVLTAMAARLNDEYSNVRQAVVKALGKHEALPDAVLTAVAARLDDENWDVRQAAIKALGKRETLPDAVLTAVAARLDDEYWDVRQAAINALGKRETLPDAVLTAVAARLDHKDWDVRHAAVKALGEREALPDVVLTAVAARLNDEDWDVRQAAVKALGKCEALPDVVLIVVAARLNHKDSHVRQAVVKALGKHEALPDAVLMAVAARLNDEHWDVRQAAINALGKRETLPDAVLIVVAARLDDKDWHVRWAAVKALGEREALPDAVLTAVAARLDDEHSDVRIAAVRASGERETLPDVVLTAVAARLDDEDWYVRRAAVEALGKREALPDAVLTAVAARLDDEYWDVRTAAVNVLLKMHTRVCRTVLEESLITPLYKDLLQRSFVEQLSWYIEKDTVYVNMPDGITKFSIDTQQNKVRQWINRARPADYPSASGEESSSSS